jgi:hypothetical protein
VRFPQATEHILLGQLAGRDSTLTWERCFSSVTGCGKRRLFFFNGICPLCVCPKPVMPWQIIVIHVKTQRQIDCL